MFRIRRKKADDTEQYELGLYPEVTVSSELLPYIEELEQVSADLRALHDRMLAEEQAAAERRRAEAAGDVAP